MTITAGAVVVADTEVVEEMVLHYLLLPVVGFLVEAVAAPMEIQISYQ
jgi:hypothetical protein